MKPRKPNQMKTQTSMFSKVNLYTTKKQSKTVRPSKESEITGREFTTKWYDHIKDEPNFSEKVEVKLPEPKKTIARNKNVKSRKIKRATIQDVELTLRERLEDIRNRKEQQYEPRTNSKIKDGFIYLLTCPSYNGWTKVGQTTDYEKRLQTYQTSSPLANYEMVAIKWVEDSFLEEQRFLELAKVVFEVRGEWIKAPVEELMKTF